MSVSYRNGFSLEVSTQFLTSKAESKSSFMHIEKNGALLLLDFFSRNGANIATNVADIPTGSSQNLPTQFSPFTT